MLHQYYSTKELVDFEMIIFFLFLFAILFLDVMIGYKNLEYKTHNIDLSSDELLNVINVMKKIRNWQIVCNKGNSIEVICDNSNDLFSETLTTKFILNKNKIWFANYVTPSFTQSNISSIGELKKNLRYFELVIQQVKQKKCLNDIPDLISEYFKNEEMQLSELSIEIMKKRIIAYLIVFGFFAVSYTYKESKLFIPSLILPLIG